MKSTILFSVLFAVSLPLLSTPELLRNSSFRNGQDGWRILRRTPANAIPVSFSGGRLAIDIPASADLAPGALQLAQTLSLDPRKEYRIALTVKRSTPGTMIVSFRTGKDPRRNLGLVKEISLPEGVSSHSLLFSPLSMREKNNFSELCLWLGSLKGQTELQSISVTEIPLRVFKPGNRWQFTLRDPGVYDRIPENTGSLDLPFQNRRGKAHIIDFAKLGGTAGSSGCAVVFQEFDSAEEYSARLGFSADYFMEIILNGNPVYSTMTRGNGTGTCSVNDHIVRLPVRKGRNILAVRVKSGSMGWKLFYGIPEKPVRYETNESWKAVDTRKLHIKQGSTLDLSSLIDAPAGKYGRLRLGRTGLAEFEKRPGRPVRLHGFSSGIPREIWLESSDAEFRAKADRYAAAVRRQGYNLYRMHGLDSDIMQRTNTDMEFSPHCLDRWDYLISAFKKQGIYVQYVVFSFNLYNAIVRYRQTFDKRNMHKMLFNMGGSFERERFRTAVTKLLNHVNPYTNLAWKDDPAIALVEYYNETFLGIGLYANIAKKYPADHRFILSVWNDWLNKRYPGRTDGTAGIPGPSDPYYKDYPVFLTERLKETHRWCETVVREAGYPGLVTQNFSFQLYGAAAGWETLPVVDNHIYFCHPSDWSNPGSNVRQDSAAGNAASYFRNLMSARLAGHPQFVGEFNFCFWNPWQHEAALVFNAYAAYQDFSGLAIHSDPVPAQGGIHTIGNFSSGTNPTLRAAQFLSAMFFLRRDVTPSPHQLTLNITPDYLQTGAHGMNAVSGEQTKIALLSGFSIAFPGLPSYPGTAGRKADLTLAPDGTAQLESHGWHVDLLSETGRNRNSDRLIQEMKRRGILKKDNISRPSAGIFQSDTGELTLRSGENLVKVVTPRTEAVTMRKGRSEPLGVLSVESSSADACIAVTSIDGLPLAESRRMVLVYSTRSVNSGMELLGGTRLVKLGSGPALMRTGQLCATLAGKGEKGWKLHTLNLAGERTGQLPLSVWDGDLLIRIDTATLKNGVTPFFELIRE